MVQTPLQKAQSKYKDYLRNYLHYTNTATTDLMENPIISEAELKDLETKRNHCNDVMETLLFIFGAEVKGETK